MKVFSTNHTSGGMKVNGANVNGACQPPKNMITVSALIRIMFMYSARKKSAKVMPEYSIMWPATISDSPSTTSNGARLVSATPETKYTTRIGSSGSQFHDRKLRPRSANQPLACASTMSERFRLPDTMSTTTSAKPIASSYDTICAAERIAPRKAYFEFDAQPATMTP